MYRDNRYFPVTGIAINNKYSKLHNSKFKLH